MLVHAPWATPDPSKFQGATAMQPPYDRYCTGALQLLGTAKQRAGREPEPEPGAGGGDAIAEWWLRVKEGLWQQQELVLVLTEGGHPVVTRSRHRNATPSTGRTTPTHVWLHLDLGKQVPDNTPNRKGVMRAINKLKSRL